MSAPREEMNRLLNACLPFARQMIEEHGEFHPFGASIAIDGSVRLEAAHDTEKHPPGQEVIELLSGSLRERAVEDAIKASAICANVSIRQPEGHNGDAIQMTIEHRDADPIRVVMPYRRKRLRGYEFGTLTTAEGFTSVFIG